MYSVPVVRVEVVSDVFEVEGDDLHAVALAAARKYWGHVKGWVEDEYLPVIDVSFDLATKTYVEAIDLEEEGEN